LGETSKIQGNSQIFHSIKIENLLKENNQQNSGFIIDDDEDYEGEAVYSDDSDYEHK
jgi:hypothetical protein